VYFTRAGVLPGLENRRICARACCVASGGRLLGDSLNGPRLRSSFGKGAVGSLVIRRTEYLVLRTRCSKHPYLALTHSPPPPRTAERPAPINSAAGTDRSRLSKPGSQHEALGCCTLHFGCLRTCSHLGRSTGHLIPSTGYFVRSASNVA